MMASTIFLAEVDRRLEISIFVPSHEDSISEEREATEVALFVFLDRCLSFIDRLSFEFSIAMDGDEFTGRQEEILFRITDEILIPIDSKEGSIDRVDMTILIALVVGEDEWLRWKLEIRRRGEHLIVEPLDEW